MTVGRYRVGPGDDPARRSARSSRSRHIPARGSARLPTRGDFIAARQPPASVSGYPSASRYPDTDDGLGLLDVGYSSKPTRSSPSRHRRQRAQRRSLTAFVVVIALFSLLALVGWWGYGKARNFLSPEDYSGSGSGSVSVQIRDGDSISAMGDTLARADVVKSAGAFVDVAKDNDRASKLQPGTYALRKKMSAVAALELLLDPNSRLNGRFTAREGLSVIGILAIINQRTGIPLDELKKAAANPASLGIPDWAHGNLEGFLFPDTYDVSGTGSAGEVLGIMVAHAVKVMGELNFVQRAQQLGYQPYDVLKVASMVEMEGISEDFGKIARVAYNRLEQKIGLQFDSTTQYWLELSGKGRNSGKLSDNELRAAGNDYSTTVNPGLPPTAISNPGKAAMEAALSPPAGDWRYFAVTEKSGKSSFAVALPEHERNVEVCRRNHFGC